MGNPTDYGRWLAVSKDISSWQERNVVLGKMITPGSSVVDVGAGNRFLREQLPDGCEYQAVDCVNSSEETIIADFNKDVIPVLPRFYEFVVCSGIMEYIVDPGEFLKIVTSWGKITILSYAVADTFPDVTARRANGWINDIEVKGLVDLFTSQQHDYKCVANWRG
ncbi:MAG TPA: hypothetical protein ENI62_03355 [Gammaproteobacteria bacterium]|nr:hypothetical protein [Gammaproteobacteria bacterium]